jgi:hypothetical protein
MDKFNIAVLVDAKQEYTHQLVQLLYPQIYIGIKSIYDVAREYCEQSKDNNILKKFQQLLSNVPKWNTDRIDAEFKRIQKNTECDWIEDLITAVFVSHTKVLTAIQLKNNNKKTIQLNVPQGPFFIHKCYTEVARSFWKRPYLFNHLLSPIDLQRNLADSEVLIKDAIHETVRKMLPVRHILKEYLGSDYNDDEIDDDITSQLSMSTKNNLRKLVQQEIEQTLSKKDELLMESELIKQIEQPNNDTKKIITNPNINNVEQELLDAISSNTIGEADNKLSVIKLDNPSNQLDNNSNIEHIDNKVDKVNEPSLNDNIELIENNIETTYNDNLETTVNDNVEIAVNDNLETAVNDNVEMVVNNNVEIDDNVENEVDNNKEDKGGNMELVVEKKLGLTDIFDTKYEKNIKHENHNETNKEKNKSKYDNIDIFSFFDDAAPFHK